MSTDPAKGRFLAIQFLRISGVALILLAMLILARKVDLPQVAGYLIGVAGLFDAFVAPLLLARRWKSPPP